MKIYAVVGSTQANAMIGGGNVSPTLTTAMGTGGGQIPMIIEKGMQMKNEKAKEYVGIKVANKRGYIECEIGGGL